MLSIDSIQLCAVENQQLSKDAFFIINRNWQGKLEILLGADFALLTKKQFLTLPDNYHFVMSGGDYVIKNGNVETL